MGTRPGAHKCKRTIEAAVETTERYECKLGECGKSFLTRQGLANHHNNHRRRERLEAVEVALPRPATHQNPATQIARGSDARVPIVEHDSSPSPPQTRSPAPGTTTTQPPQESLDQPIRTCPTPFLLAVPIDVRREDSPRRDSPRNERYRVMVASWTCGAHDHSLKTRHLRTPARETRI